MASSHAQIQQILAAEAVLKPYITDPKVCIAALALEIVNAYMDNAPAKKARLAAKSPNTKLPEECPNEHGRELAMAHWAKSGRHDLVPRLDDIIEGFRAHHTAVGSIMEDWRAAWVTWYRNALKFEKVDRQLSLVPPNGYEEASSEGWCRRLEIWMGQTDSPKGTWRAIWGPAPKLPGCKVPESAKELYFNRHPKNPSETA